MVLILYHTKAILGTGLFPREIPVPHLSICFPGIFSQLDESLEFFNAPATLLPQVKKCRRLAYFVTRGHDVQSLN